jgi:elongation factor Tu
VIVPGTKVELLGLGDTLEMVVTSVEQFNRPLERAVAGQNVGLLLRSIKADQVRRGQVLAALRSLSLRTRFPGEVYALDEDEGGEAHALSQRLQAAVLLPHDKRDRGSHSARRSGHGDAQ